MGLSELPVISWVSTVEGFPLSEVPLYNDTKADKQYLPFNLLISVSLICYGFHQTC